MEMSSARKAASILNTDREWGLHLGDGYDWYAIADRWPIAEDKSLGCGGEPIIYADGSTLVFDHNEMAWEVR